MAKMEKTRHPGIYKRGSRYVVVWTYRGKQHKESHRTLAEAREAKGQRQGGDRRPASRVTFGEYFEGWIESYAGRTSRGFSETTRPEYRRPIEAHALTKWRAWRMADVEPGDVRDLFGDLRRDGASTSAIKKLRAALSAMFASAVEDGAIRSNPFSGVRIPTGGEEPSEEKAKALTREELRLVLAALPERWRLFFEFLAHSGLRISEAIGLTWAHLDLGERPKVKVREQVYRGQRKRLKSRDGLRDVPLSRGMTERLLAHRARTYKGEDRPVFASSVGTELIPGKVMSKLSTAAISVGLSVEVTDQKGKKRTRSTVTFHTFRHTCASLLFEDGRNVKQVSEWLGHADPAFTLRTYVHLMDDGVGDADFLDQAVGGGKGVARQALETAANGATPEVVETAG